MNVLDGNIPEDERLALLQRRVHVRQIGVDIGRKGLDDKQIVSLLHTLDRPTFFTLDEDFYRRTWCHNAFCLVQLDIHEKFVATYIRRVLRHPALNSKAKRMGLVVQGHPTGLTVWRIHAKKEAHFDWD